MKSMYAKSKNELLKKSLPGESATSGSVPRHDAGTVNTDPGGVIFMKKIQLTQNKFALVDNEDYEKLMQWKWCAAKNNQYYYAHRSVNFVNKDGKRTSTTIKMHREIVNAPNGFVVDHINHNTLDNRKSNLRVCTQRENCMNLIIKNKTGFIGVTQSKKRYKAVAMINGKVKQLGRFDTAKNAHDLYIKTVKG